MAIFSLIPSKCGNQTDTGLCSSIVRSILLPGSEEFRGRGRMFLVCLTWLISSYSVRLRVKVSILLATAPASVRALLLYRFFGLKRTSELVGKRWIWRSDRCWPSEAKDCCLPDPEFFSMWCYESRQKAETVQVHGSLWRVNRYRNRCWI